MRGNSPFKASTYGRILVTLFIAWAFLACFSFCACAQEEGNEEEELQQLKKELLQEREKLKETVKKEQEALGKFYTVNRALKNTEKELSTLKYQIEGNKKRIIELSDEIDEADKDLKITASSFEQRIAEAYKGGRANYLELLFASRSLADFINRSYYFEKIIAADIDLIREIRLKQKRSAELKDELKGRAIKLGAMTSSVVKKKEEIKENAVEKQKLYESLNRRRKEYERKVSELEKSSKDLERLIRSKTAGAGTPAKVTGSMAWPVEARIVSKFGYRRHPIWGGRHFHTGIDLAAAYGWPIRAADGGEVILSSWWDGYGKAVVINHGNGATTVYGHMSRIHAAKGDFVAKGQIIGLVGSTGYSTGPHLHFEIRKWGEPVDPVGYLP